VNVPRVVAQGPHHIRVGRMVMTRKEAGSLAHAITSILLEPTTRDVRDMREAMADYTRRNASTKRSPVRQ
jgi:hypothetical protein